MNSSDSPGSLTPAEAVLLLDHLITDAAFRAAFTTDGVAALASIGIAANRCTDCLDVDVLASAEELQAVRAELERFLSGSESSMHVIFCFEAGKVSDSIS